MKVFHLSYSDSSGGASRSAYRIHESLLEAGVDSRMLVNKAYVGDWRVEGPTTKISKALAALGPSFVGPLVHTLKTSNPIIHSPAILPSQWVSRINSSDADVVHLHWVQAEMLSISDIGRIRKPIVWTLHDMWGFCGAEHLASDDRWREGYRSDNRPAHESGFDLNRWTWLRKRKHWRKSMQIVTPSRWLASCVRDSELMRDWPVAVVANPINTERWKPLARSVSRELLGLPDSVPLILFGSSGANHLRHKGFDLLLRALEHLRHDPRARGTELIVFGQRAPRVPVKTNFPVHFVGHLHDDLSLRALYSAADAMLIPSRQDNLPNTGVEAHACGTPVVAFQTCGLPDIVEHQRTGYLAKAFDAEDFAQGIAFVLAQRGSGSDVGVLGKQARLRAEEQFSASMAAKAYRKLYDNVS